MNIKVYRENFTIYSECIMHVDLISYLPWAILYSFIIIFSNLASGCPNGENYWPCDCYPLIFDYTISCQDVPPEKIVDIFQTKFYSDTTLTKFELEISSPTSSVMVCFSRWLEYSKKCSRKSQSRRVNKN